eukprot:Clim_evm62s146 gene=Clim_evmTU62s146
MAYLDTLKFSGLRSFAGSRSQREQAIDFTSGPLTIICGENGAGKTTIIEALKYVTTGESPSNKTFFVHDPRVSKSSDTKAKVELSFYSKDGNYYQCTRRLESKLDRANNPSVKTLQCELTFIDKITGQRVQRATRVATLDNEVVGLFAVPKSVLEHVIFCHQEDSNWPLKDNSSVKKKFDEIFSSDRYEQVLNELKKQKKDIAQKRILNERDVENKMKEVSIAKTKKRAYKAAEAELNTKYAEHAKLTEEVTSISMRLSELREKLKEKRQAERELEDKQSTLGHRNETVEHLQSRLGSNLMAEATVDDLTQLIAADCFADATDDRNLEQARTELLTNEAELEQLNQTEKELGRDLGGVERQDVDFEARCSEKVAMMKKLAQQFPIAISTGGLESQDGAFEFEDALSMLKNNKEEAQREKRAAFHEEETAAERQAYEAQVALKDRQTRIQQQEQKQKILKREQDALRAQVAQIEEDNREYLRQLRLVKEIKAQMTAMEESEQVNRWHARRDEIRKERTELTVEIKQAEGDLRSASEYFRQKASVEKLEMQLEIEEKHLQAELTAIHQKARESGTDWYVEVSSTKLNLKRADEDTFSKREEESDLREEIAASKAELEHLRREDMQRRAAFEDLEAKMEALRRKDDDTKSLEEVQKCLVDEEHHLQSLKVNSKAVSVLEAQVKKQIKSLEEDECCPLCQRSFEKRQHAIDLLRKLEEKLEKLPERARQQEAQIEPTVTRIDVLTNLVGVKMELMNNAHHTSAQKEMESVKHQLVRIEQHLLESELKLDTLQQQMEANETLRHDIRDLVHRETQIESIQDRLAAEQSVLSSLARSFLGDGVTEKEMYQALEDLRSRHEKLGTEFDRVQSDIDDHHHRMDTIRRKHEQANGKCRELETGVAKVDQIKETLTLKNEEFKATGDLIVGLRNELSLLQTKERETVRQAQLLRERHAEELHGLSDELLQMTEAVTSFKSLHAATSPTVKAELLDRIQNIKASLKHIVTQRETAENTVQTLRSNVQALLKDKDTRDAQKQKLRDNLQLKELLAGLDTLQSECEDLKKLFAHTWGPGSANEHIEIEMDQQVRRRERAITDEVSLATTMDNRKKEIKRMKDEYQQYYAAAEDEMIQIKVDLEIQKVIASDLDTTFRAVELAIQKYHRLKMDNINRTIAHYWSKTYRGNDVDNIRIRAHQTATAGADAKRTYDYSVVMVKNGAELEMRNRCSAGQKVLASLIIRLALAEEFGLDCGIMALDEPTTNLDKENIEALAQAVCDIVEERKIQHSFQLLVITHDVEFVKMLNMRRLCRTMHIVQRNSLGVSEVIRRDFGATDHLGG